MARPIVTKKIVKKRVNKFVRFESEDFGKLKSNWRRPRGIDNRVRRRFRGNKRMPHSGYGSDLKTKFLLPSGFKKFVVTNLKDLEILLTNNRFYCGELAHNLSARKKAQLVKRAAELDVRLTNGKGKLKAEEKKPEAGAK